MPSRDGTNSVDSEDDSGISLQVVNEPLENISHDLGFNRNSLAEVSTCLGGAFIGSLFSGWIADEFGRRRTFQLCALPMLIDAACRFRLLLCVAFSISMRAIYDARLSDKATVADMVENDRWKWPNECLSLFPFLQSIKVPLLQANEKDHAVWKSNNGG
ncbi:probable plastidic glucose transporter 2 isoform X1 [Tanacetum coccineum]